MPPGSPAQVRFVTQFEAAVASVVPTIDVSDVTVQSVQPGSIIVQTQVRVSTEMERQQLRLGLENPVDVFSGTNGFDTALYGVPLIFSSPSPAPTPPDSANKAGSPNFSIYIAVAAGIALCMMGCVIVLCATRRRNWRNMVSGKSKSIKSETNQSSKLVKPQTQTEASSNRAKKTGILRLRTPRSEMKSEIFQGSKVVKPETQTEASSNRANKTGILRLRSPRSELL